MPTRPGNECQQDRAVREVRTGRALRLNTDLHRLIGVSIGLGQVARVAKKIGQRVKGIGHIGRGGAW